MNITIGNHTFREDGSHYNGGRIFFGYGFIAIGEPRLKIIRRWYRQGADRGRHEDHFYVDGAEVAHYDEALHALSIPVAFTAEEIAALSIIGDDPANHKNALGFELIHSLTSKGAIAWGPPGHCRRTDIGRAAAARASS